MIEGSYNRDTRIVTYNNIPYKLKGMIDVQGLTVDEINAQAGQIYKELGRAALVYTNKGLWDGLEDKSGLKDNIAAKTDLFLAWFGTVQPEYGHDNSVLPTGWAHYVLWNDQADHFKLIKDGGEALATLLEYAEVYTGDGGSSSSSNTTSSGSLVITCPSCGHILVNVNLGTS